MAQPTVLCVARQFGSGGHEVGLALAREMGIPFYDKELLKTAAEKSGIMHELFEKSDEKPVRGLIAPGGGKAASFADYATYLPNDSLQNVVAQVIREAAAQPCVIIGRCADFILRGRPGMLSIFVHADMETRVQRIARLNNLDEDAARALIRKTDRARANYYRFYTDRDWGSPDNYHLSVDAGRLGVGHTVALLKEAARLFCG